MAATFLTPSTRTTRSIRSFLPVSAVRAEGARTVVVLRGEWDFSSGPVLADVLSRVTAGQPGDVVIDLAEADFLDSAAVHTLVVARQRLARRGRNLTLRSPSAMVTRMLEVLDLSDLLEAGDEPKGIQP